MNRSLSKYWREMASGRDRGAAARFWCALLCIPSLLYGSVQKARAALFRVGILEVKHLPRPVVSVGNITVGGTGKTPITALIAGMLLERGVRVTVLSRGYGGTCEGTVRIVSDGKNVFLSAHECGDEPFLLASTVPGLMVVIGSDRYAAGLLALEQLQPDVFLLDDGYQHLRLRRDLNVLLMDYARPFGNGCCLPAGLLREPQSAADRADLVIHTRCPDKSCLARIVPDRPNVCAQHIQADLIPLMGGEPLQYEALSGKNVMAVAGIAEPDLFFDSLRAKGLVLVTALSLPDHAAYDADTLCTIVERFQASDADLLLTTEKDGVKLSSILNVVAEKTLLCRLTLQLHDPAPLVEALCNLLQK